MIKNHFYYVLFLCLGLPLVGHSQSEAPTFVTEHAMLHTDRQLYISGETIWFKMYVLVSRGNRLSDFSKIGYLELVSQEGTAVSRTKVALDKGNGTGTIKLPKTLNSGSYTLKAYTQGLRNSGEEGLGKLKLIILNPEQPIIRATADQPEAYEKFEPKEQSIVVPADKYLDVEIQTAQTTYAQRTKTTLEISTKDADGRAIASQFSISVALQAPAKESESGLFRETGTNTISTFPIPPMTITYQPETHGMGISGRVINEGTNNGEPDAEVYLAFPGKTALVYAAKTGKAGRFSFLLPKLFGLRQVVVQVRPKNETQLRLELTDEFHEMEAVTSTPFVLPPAWEPLAKAAMVNAQVGQAYEAFELEPVYSTDDPFGGIPFFGKPEAQYYLDDFTRFPLPEFFFEVVPEVRVRGKYGAEQLAVLNEWIGPEGEIPPLLLVDGVPVFDERKFLKINNKLIASTEVVTAPFWLNPGIFDGVIQISSFESDARCFTLPKTALRRSFLTLLPQQQFNTPDHEAKPDSRLPDFRNTLYWNPSIETDVEGKATISFFTSDALGTYNIRVESVSDQGLLGTGSKVIRVVK